MSKDKVRIGLLGVGGIGYAHLGMWTSLPSAEVVAVCDIVPERADNGAKKGTENYAQKEVGYKGEIEAYYDLAEMLKKADIDAVDVCTWSGLHAEHGLMALQAGKHTLIEKPIDLDLVKIDRLIAEADRTKLKVGCIFQSRFGAEIRRAHDLIKAGKIGKIISCSVYCKWWRGQDYYDSASWRGTWALDGGCLANQGVHSIDQLCWMAGPVAEVEYSHIETAMHKMEAEDFAIAVVRFENGARGVVEGTTSAFPGFSTKVEIFGDKGSASFDGSRVLSFQVVGEEIDLTTKEEKAGDGRADPLAIGLGGHAAQLSEFANCVLYDEQPYVNAREARIAVDCLNKIYKKAGVAKIGT